MRVLVGVSPCGLGVGGWARGDQLCMTVTSWWVLVHVGWGRGWGEGPVVYESDKLAGVSPCGLGVEGWVEGGPVVC